MISKSSKATKNLISCLLLSATAAFIWTLCLFYSQNTLYHNTFWYPYRVKLYHMWGGLESLHGRFTIANNQLSSRPFIGKQRLFSRERVHPKKISMDISLEMIGYADILFNFNNETFKAIRLSRHPKIPSMVYTSNIDGQFLEAYKIPIKFWQTDKNKKYSISLEQTESEKLKLKVDGKEEMDIPEQFSDGYIGLEINEFARIASPSITLQNGQVLDADFKMPFNFFNFGLKNFLLISTLVLLLSLLTFKHFYQSLIVWPNIILAAGVSWYLFDYFDYSKRSFRWSFPDESMILSEDVQSKIDYEKYRYAFFRRWYAFLGGENYNNLPETKNINFKFPRWKALNYCQNDFFSKIIPENPSIPDNTIRFMILGGSMSEGFGADELDDNYHARIQKELLRLYGKKLQIESSFVPFNVFLPETFNHQLQEARDKIKKFKPSYLIFNTTAKSLKRIDILEFLNEITRDGIIVSLLDHTVENPDPKDLEDFTNLHIKNMEETGNPYLHFHFMNSYIHSEENRLTGNLWWDHSHLSSYGHYLFFEGFFPQFLEIIKKDRAKRKLFH